MRILLAIASLIISATLLGFVAMASVEAVTMWGVREAVAEIFGFWLNAVIFIGCFTIGSAFFCLAAVVLAGGPVRTE